MRPSLLSVLSLALVLLAPAAGSQPAPQPPTGETLQRLQLRHCSRLIWQFDGSVARMPPDPTLERARAARNQGERFCNRGNPARGVPLLQSALHDIGVNPTAPP